MKRSLGLLLACILLSSFSGCILGDQLATLAIHPDGSADWLRIQSNIRSSEAGAAGEEELKRYIAEFDARKDADTLAIEKAGGEVVSSQWIRRQEPLTTVVQGRFRGEASLLAFLTVKGEKGEDIVRPRLSRDGDKRRLSLEIVPPAEAAKDPPALRQEQANALSETRIVPVGGRIVNAKGFAVAEDRRSALLGQAEVRDILSRREKVEIHLEWEL